MTTDQRPAAGVEMSRDPQWNGAVAARRPRDGGLRHSPHPTLLGLPGLYHEDHLVQGICSAADAALAPVFAILDNFAAHLDPATTPPDLLGWLAEWIGAVLPAGTDPTQRRQSLQRAAEHLPWHGTVFGVRAALSAIHGTRVEIDETGATAWTLDPDTPLPGEPPDRPVLFRVTTSGPTEPSPQMLDALLARLKPAHVPHRTEIG